MFASALLFNQDLCSWDFSSVSSQDDIENICYNVISCGACY